MPTLRFEGYSDDTFGELTTGVDYDNCANGKRIELEVENPAMHERLLVVGQFCPGRAGGWLIGVAPCRRGDGEDESIPDWPMAFERSERPYSPALVIEAPEGAVVRCITGARRGEG